MSAEPRDGAPQERDCGGALLVPEHLDVREPREVIDADVHELPTSSGACAVAHAGDAVARRPEPPELLDVEMQQLPRDLPLVPRVVRRRVQYFNRPAPARLTMRATAERGILSREAICSLVIRFTRRSSSTSSCQLAGTRLGDRSGRDEPFSSPGSPSSSKRDSHLYAVLMLTPAASTACATAQPSSRTRRTRRPRPKVVIRAERWVFIRFASPCEWSLGSSTQPRRWPDEHSFSVNNVLRQHS